MALENRNSVEMVYYLDQETGEDILIMDEWRSQLENVVEEYGDEETGEIDWETILPQLGIPDWQKDTLILADQVDAGFGERYIGIIPTETYESCNDMEEFIDMVSNDRLANRLSYAIRGTGAFRRFKDILLDYPNERQRWFDFKSERMKERAIEWLADKGDRTGLRIIEIPLPH